VSDGPDLAFRALRERRPVDFFALSCLLERRVGRLTFVFDPAGLEARFTRLVLVVRRLIIST
jgi:hypothetical protein